MIEKKQRYRCGLIAWIKGHKVRPTSRACTRLLAERGVTVISGLARGIDTAAHRGALDAGARTIAVLGTGITRCYPSENRDLAEAITTSGALVSQFWPTRAPGRDTFPRRNVVTSGISQGTVVIEAARTSGARMQARLALEHGKKVFLVRSLVTTQPWAKDCVDRRGAIEVADVDEVSAELARTRTRAAGDRAASAAVPLVPVTADAPSAELPAGGAPGASPSADQRSRGLPA